MLHSISASCLVWCIGLLMMVACSPSDSAACAVARAALFHGTPDSGELALRPEQQQAIGVIESSEDGGPLCSMTLISPGLAISAAHCAAVPANGFRLSGEATTQPFHWAALHPSLDIAVLAVDWQPPANASAPEPIPLHEAAIDSDWIGAKATLAGLGKTETGSVGELRFAQERVMKVTDTEIWVDGMGASGACGGDSGGPLLVRDGEGLVTIAGVLDRGSANCVGLDVYTRADLFAAWLRDTNTDTDTDTSCQSNHEP